MGDTDRGEWSVSPIYSDDCPSIEDGGHDMVRITRGGKFVRIVPFDVFSAYVYEGLRFIKEVQARRSEAAAKIIPLRKRRPRAAH